MAKLADYDKRSIEDHSDCTEIMGAINCMEAILSFPIYETTSTDNEFDISGFEKSFWGSNKLKAYTKISVIDDHKLEITVPAGTDDLPPYYDVAIGFAFSSDYYSSYQNENGYFILGKTRKTVFSYYWFMECIEAKIDMYKAKEIDVVTAFINDELSASVRNMSRITILKTIKSMFELLKYEVTTNE
jgi:hypothetical protein